MLLPDGQACGLAVSGGPDSLALLLLAHAALPGRFAVATVDHGLRSESAAEAAMVAGLCAERGIHHTTITLNMRAGASVQERARVERYAALGDWAMGRNLSALVTAHHADDQAETLVMRLNRGAGLRGLAGIRPRALVPGRNLPLLRPLLGWRRGELAHVLDISGVVAVDDPSNRDMRFERARVRAGMTSASWLEPAGLAASAAHLAEADEAVAWAASQELGKVRQNGDTLCWTPGVPRVIAMRTLEDIVRRLGGAVARGSELARWHDALAGGAVATLAGVRGDGRGVDWIFSIAPPPRPAKQAS